MLAELTQNPVVMMAAAFLIGWLLSAISGSLRAKYRARQRDARDDRIRSLEATARIVQSDFDKAREKLTELEKELEESNDELEKRDNVISDQQQRMASIKKDLKDSVLKTRDLRSELTERATDIIKSEVKLRDVETELSIAQASTDMIATGILDYTSESEEDDGAVDSDMSKAAT